MKPIPRHNHLLRLARYLIPHQSALFGVLVALMFTSGSVLGIGKGIQYLIDKGFQSQNPALLDRALLVLLCVTVLLAVATYARASLINAICEKVVAAIRQDAYDHMVRLDALFYETHKTSDIVSRLTTDTTLVNNIIANVVSVTLRNMVLFIGGLTMLFWTSPKLAAYVLVIVPLVLIPILVLGRKVRTLSRISQEKVALFAAHTEESLTGIKTVQAYTREVYESMLSAKHTKEALDAALERVRVRAFLVALVISTVFGAVACVLWIGGHDVLKGTMSPGALSSFIFYSIVVASSVGALSEVAGDVQRARGATERIFALLDAEPTITDPLPASTLPDDFRGDIALHHMTFAYPMRSDVPVLSDISLHINPGEMVAFVGPSGAGKSTLFHLLLRFYDPTSGTITLGGKDHRALSLHSLRSQFGVVSQDPVIFSCSAYDNIRYGRSDASEEEIIEAARAAEALPFLAKLPEGIHTYVGERGLKLSGGQRQRIAIARAILKNPKVLLLDEATSALDAENELAVQKALEALMAGRTTLVIAHRLATILQAHKIIVLNEGRIEATGTHQTLLSENGLYARLAKLQFHA